MPWSERQRLQFYAEAFNAFNHENFVDPKTNISGSTFGVLSASAERARGKCSLLFAARSNSRSSICVWKGRLWSCLPFHLADSMLFEVLLAA